jgi:hypothetical protein
MGNNQSIKKISFEDVQYVIKNDEMFMLINTLSQSEQNCLIYSTSDINKEEELINKFMKLGNYNVKLVVYGKNSNDEKIFSKAEQLRSLGFTNTFIYTGGLFEWLMLQDIYGSSEFPTTSSELDILKYKPNKILNLKYIEF